MSLSPVGDLGIALKADIDDYQKSMATASDAAGVLGGSIRGLAASMRNMGLAMTAASGVVAGGMYLLSRRSMEVSQAFREVASISNEVSDAQERYGEVISDLNTEFGLQSSKIDLIDGLYQSLSAGVDAATESQREFLETAARLAVVGRVDLSTSVDVLSTMMNAYGKGTEYAQRASRTLFRTVQFGKTRLDELAPVMGRVSAMASNLGIAIEETGAAMSVLTRTGFESRIAATALRAIMRQMLKPSQAMKTALRDIAARQDFFAEKMEEGSETARALAQTYRDARDAIRAKTQAINKAQQAQTEASNKLAEARLMEMALQQDRVNAVQDMVSENIAQVNSVEELNEIMDKYRLKQQKARVQEQQAREEKKKHQQQVQSVRNSLEEQLNITGNLSEGIGQFITANRGLVETLQLVQQYTKDTGVTMAELFPEVRGLQGVMALVGDQGEALRDIFNTMQAQGVEAAKEEVKKFKEEGKLTEEQASDLGDTLKTMPEEYKAMTGPIHEVRNAMSELKESLEEIGSLFTDDIVGMIRGVTDLFVGLKNSLEALDEETRSAIGRFVALASSIGLVLGPLLFFGGQLALIAGALGSSLVPMLALAVPAVAVLASAFSSVVSGGEESQSVLNSLGSFLDMLITRVRSIAGTFRKALAGPLASLGDSIISLFQRIGASLSEVGGSGSGSAFQSLAKGMGSVIGTISTLISQNEEAIASFVQLAAQTVVGTVIPALRKFGSWIISTGIPVVQDLWSIFTSQAIPILVDGFNVLVNQTFPAIANVIRQDIVPVLGQLFDVFKTELVPFITSQLIPTIAKLWEKLTTNAVPKATSTLTKDLVPAVREAFQVFRELWPQIERVLLSVASLLPPLIKLAGALMSLGVEIMKSPIIQGILKAAIAALVPPIVLLAKVLKPVINIIAEIIIFLEPVIVLFVEAVAVIGAIAAAAWVVAGALGGIIAAASTVASVIGTIIALANPVTAIFLGIVGAVMAAIYVFKNWSKITKWVSGAIDDVIALVAVFPAMLANILASGISILWNFFNNTFVKKIAGAGGFVAKVIDDSVAMFTALPQKLVKGINSAIGNLWSWFNGTFVSKLLGKGGIISGAAADMVSAFTSLPGDIISGLSGTFGQLWVWFDENVVASLVGEDGIFSNLTDSIVSEIGDLPSELITEILKHLNTLKLLGQTVATKIEDGLGDAIGTLSQMIDIDMEEAKQWGKNLVNAIADGIRAAGDVIKDAIRDAAGHLARFLPSSPADEGPLSKSGTPPGEAGRGLMQGIAKGIKDEGSPMGLLGKMLQMPDSQMNMSGLGAGTAGRGAGQGGGVTVSEKAVYFEKGAFQGVSDEELPQKVSKEVDNQLEQIVERIRGKGKGTDTRK